MSSQQVDTRRTRIRWLWLAVGGIGMLIGGVTLAGSWPRDIPATDGKIVVTAPADQGPFIAEIVRYLQANGHTRFTDAAKLSTAVSAETRAVVFTPSAFRAADPSLLETLYDRGVAIGALDVGAPELRSRTASGDRLTPDDSQGWIPPSPNYTIFSITRTVRHNGGSVGTTSDVVHGPDIVTRFVNHALAVGVRGTPTATVPVIPIKPRE